MVTATALILITHDGIDRREVLDVLRQRWAHVVVKDPEGRSAHRGDVGPQTLSIWGGVEGAWSRSVSS